MLYGLVMRPSKNKLVAFKKESITNTFGEFLAAHKKTQVRIAETEKYAHVPSSLTAVWKNPTRVRTAFWFLLQRKLQPMI